MSETATNTTETGGQVHPMVISVRQPWAWLLIRPDIVGEEARAKAYSDGLIKDVENRDWFTKVRSRVLIHASKGMTRNEYFDTRLFVNTEFKYEIELPPFEELQRGGIIGSVEIVDCVSKSQSPWFFGRYGFVSRNSQPLPFHPCKGQLGFFSSEGMGL
jgi:hypothetical protein